MLQEKLRTKRVPRRQRAPMIVLLLLLPLVLIASVQAQTANIDFWDMGWGPPEYIDVARELVAQFNEEHPGIEVEYRAVPWNNWYQTFLTAVGSGTAPDLSTGASFLPVQFYDVGAIAPIDDLIAELEREGQLADYVPGVVEVFNYQGDQVALPWSIGTRSWYYRKSLLEEAGVEPPTNWEEFKAVAEALTEGDQYGIVASGDTGGTHYLYTLIVNNGGGLFTASGEPDLLNERNLEALAFYSELAKSGVIHAASAGYSLGDARTAFARGDAAIILDGPGLFRQLSDIADDIGVFAPIEGPHGDHGTFRAVNGIMLYSQSDHPEEAKTFMKWWAEHQAPLWSEGNINGNVPARQSFLADPFFQDNATAKYVVDNYLPIGQHIGANYPGFFPALNEIEGEGFMQTLAQDLLQGKDLMQSVNRAKATFDSIVRNLDLAGAE
jgi:multiple sugar transport system substrate-binding protein